MTKDIEREAFEAAWLVPHELKFFDFDSNKNQYVLKVQELSDLDYLAAQEAYHSINSGWSMWLKAKAHEAKKLEGCVVVPESEIGRLKDRITELLDERQD